MRKDSLEELEKRIGYRFRDKELLNQAMCHSSYVNEQNERSVRQTGDNERLEFLGDAVLEVISSDFLFHAYPDMPEGRLTRLRASIVCEPTLAICARDLHVDQCLRLGRGEEQTGGRGRDSIVSDAMEALIGAVYLDGGFDSAKAFVERFVMTDIEHKKLFYDSKTVLQEMTQRDFRDQEISYVLTAEKGPAHDKRFSVSVNLGTRTIGTGEGSTKKSAEQRAAYQAILLLRKEQADVFKID